MNKLSGVVLAPVLMLGVLAVMAPGARALPLISEIDIPITGASYNASTGDLSLSGRPASDVSVFYDDGRSPNPVTYGFTIFDLNTTGLDSAVSGDGMRIEYASSGGLGNMTLLDGDDGFSILLSADLVSLEMTVLDPGIGAIAGSGAFEITGGSLADDFGLVGGLTTLGLSFTVPADFDSSFSALANMALRSSGADSPPLPEPAAAIVFGLGMILVARSVRRAHAPRP